MGTTTPLTILAGSVPGGSQFASNDTRGIDAQPPDDHRDGGGARHALVGDEVDDHEDRQHQHRQPEHRGGGQDAGGRGQGGLGFGGGHWFQPKWSRGPRPWPKCQVPRPRRAASTKALASRVASATSAPSARPAHRAAERLHPVPWSLTVLTRGDSIDHHALGTHQYVGHPRVTRRGGEVSPLDQARSAGRAKEVRRRVRACRRPTRCRARPRRTGPRPLVDSG